MSFRSAIEPQEEVNREPLEVYGAGPTILRIGNGGAGYTGLIRALSTAYLRSKASHGSITWTYNLSRNTHLALLLDYVDITLTYDRSLEHTAEAEGWSKTIACVFHDHFVLAGPAADPLGLRNSKDIDQALMTVLKSGRDGQAVWQSRADRSATMVKERSLWDRNGHQPWADDADTKLWYHTNLKSPAEALIAADTVGAYLLTDRSTLLRQTARQTISNTTVFFEPDSENHVLLNSCWACCAPSVPSKEVVAQVQQFLEWLMGSDGQHQVRTFGEDEEGLPFFAAVKDDYCRQLLRLGKPKNGRWIHEDVRD